MNTRAQTAITLNPESLLPSTFEVTIIKPGLANGLTYPAHMLQAAAPKFTGVSMFANHPTALDFTRAGGRNIEELAGVIETAYWSNHAVQGRARKFGPKSDLLAALAQQIIHDRDLGLPVPDIGLSADMLISQEHGMVTAINKVLAVDIVFSPAAGGAFERVLNATRSGRLRPEPATSSAESASSRALSRAARPEGFETCPYGSLATSIEIALQNIRTLDWLIAATRRLIPLLQQPIRLANTSKWAIGHVHRDWARDPDSPWSFEASDGEAIIEKGGWSLYKAAHLLCDVSEADIPEVKEVYKLPVAKLKGGQMTYFWRGVSAAYAALKGARGGLKGVPASVVAEVIEGPIGGLYKLFDKELEEGDDQ